MFGLSTSMRKSATPQRTVISHSEVESPSSPTTIAEKISEAATAAVDALKPTSPLPGQSALEADGASVPSPPKSPTKSSPAKSSAAKSNKSAKITKPTPSLGRGKMPKLTTPKSPTTPKPRGRPASKTAEPKVEFAGETGPNTSVKVDGEEQWEINRIVGKEGDVLLVKWKGWEGVWEEDYDVIVGSAPELVASFEKKFSKAEKSAKKAGRPKKAPAAKETKVVKKAAATVGTGAKRGRPAGSGAPKAKKATGTAREAVSKKKAKKVDVSKVTKSPKKAAGPKKATVSPKKAVTSPTKKAVASPRKAAASPKKVAASPKKSGRGEIKKGRGRPKKA